MSVYKIFATNLREHCAKHESIAFVCRKIDINRQQFNKYLSGQSIPNQRTLKKIATFFEINEEDFFSSGLRQKVPKHDLKSNSNERVSKNFFDHYSTVSQYLGSELFQNAKHLKAGTLKPGLYYCYTPLEHFDGFAIRSLIKIVEINNFYFFTRRTNYSSNQADGKKLILGKHKGIVLHDSTSFFLIGRNSIYFNELTILKVIQQNFGEMSLRSGVALVHGLDTEIACRLCLEYIDGNTQSVKTALKQLGVFDIGHPSISQQVRNHMRLSWQSNQSAVSITLDEKAQTMNMIQSQFRVTSEQTGC
jgi:transcriptional regulator with XRE-family HTH domain